MGLMIKTVLIGKKIKTRYLSRFKFFIKVDIQRIFILIIFCDKFSCFIDIKVIEKAFCKYFGFLDGLPFSVMHYLLVLLAAQWAGLRSYKPLIIPFGIIMIALSLFMFSNTEQLVQFTGSSFSYFLLTFLFAVPLIILVISWLRCVEEKESAS